MSVPAGYRESARRGTLLVAREDAHEALCDTLRTETLHEWAARQPGARAMKGRGTTWATTLASGQAVAVRHSMHGGMFAALTRDLFVAPTRAPRELENAVRLASAGVRTPAVIGYAVYSATGPLCRADVVTELVEGADLVAALRAPGAEVEAIAAAVSDLTRSLAKANAVHPDLNARNIVITPNGAAVLDVDRVYFAASAPGRAARLNAARLRASLAKLGVGDIVVGLTS